jgi:hypothetical protein
MNTAGCKWYEVDKDNPEDELNRATALVQETARIEQRQSSWHELNLWNATLFSNRELPGFRWGALQAERELWPTSLRTENLVESVGESMLSKACSSPLRPSLVPHGNSWRVERAVRLLDNFLTGVWRQSKAEEACILAFLDAFISGLGTVRVAFDGPKKTLHVETVFFDNLVIDSRECANRAPPRTYRIRQVMPRAAVEARYGVELDPQQVKARYVEYRDVGDEWVVVVEAWRLPDSRGKGGYHAVACAGKLLIDEVWKQDWVPLANLHWQDPLSGYFCKSGVEQLVPFQVRQNDLNDAIELSQDIACRPRLLSHANAMIDTQEWDNEAGRILTYAGTPPIPFSWPTNLAELYNERERNRAAAYSYLGISEMTANADLPNQVRLDSSAGVREARNMEDARHLRLWTRFRDLRLQVARLIMNVLGTAKNADAFTAVYHPGGHRAFAKNIPWEAVKDLDRDQYSWTLEEDAMAGTSPAARRELLRDWSSRGMGDGGEEHRMLGNSNLEWLEDCEMSGYDDIHRHLDLLEHDEYEPPTEITNLPYGIPKVTANIHRLRCFEEYKQRDPELMSIIDKHLDWLLEAQAIQQGATQPQPQPQQMPFAPTQGMPGTNASTSPHTLVNNY